MSPLKLKIIGSSLIAVSFAAFAALAYTTLFLDWNNYAETDSAIEQTGARYDEQNVENISELQAERVEEHHDATDELHGPAAWLAVDANGLSVGTLVEILYCPGIDAPLRLDGKPIDIEDLAFSSGTSLASGIFDEIATMRTANPSLAVVRVDGVGVIAIEPSSLLINLPDVLTDAVYDAVYSYAAPSMSGNNDIPGLTGCTVDGYRDGKTYDRYLAQQQYVMPIQYGTALKTIDMQNELGKLGYKLLFWDCYRPWRGSLFISEKFVNAYKSSSEIRESTGGWDISWYAASSSSGHNFGTDIDVSLVDSATLQAVDMPSRFDAFDSNAHLVSRQLSSSSISVNDYANSVTSNQACLALHDAATRCGFSELASEWWHFGDKQNEAAMRALVGNDGLDFVADL